MEYPYGTSFVYTPVAALPGGFLNGWTPDGANPPMVGLLTLAGGLVFGHIKGLVKATAAAGNTSMFGLPAGYRADPANPNYFYFGYAGGTAGLATRNTVLFTPVSVNGGFDDAGTAFTAGNCKDILLDYGWRVKG